LNAIPNDFFHGLIQCYHIGKRIYLYHVPIGLAIVCQRYFYGINGHIVCGIGGVLLFVRMGNCHVRYPQSVMRFSSVERQSGNLEMARAPV